MNADQARFWYGYMLRIANKLDSMNAGDPRAHLMYTAVNEAIRRASIEALCHTEDVTATQEMVAVDWTESA